MPPRKKKVAKTAKFDLLALASQLSAEQIEQLSRVAQNAPEIARLQKERDKLAAQLEQINAQISELTGDAPAAKSAKPGRKPGKRGPKAAGAIAAPAMKKSRKAKGGRAAPNQLFNAVVAIMRDNGQPMNRKEVVERLVETGYPVADPDNTLKAISQLFVTRPKSFARAERGMYDVTAEALERLEAANAEE